MTLNCFKPRLVLAALLGAALAPSLMAAQPYYVYKTHRPGLTVTTVVASQLSASALQGGPLETPVEAGRTLVSAPTSAPAVQLSETALDFTGSVVGLTRTKMGTTTFAGFV